MDAPAGSSRALRAAPGAGGWQKLFSSPPFLAAAVALVSVLPFLAALRFAFVYDDDVQILRNPWLASWRSLGAIFSKQSWSFLYPGADGGYYRPLFLVWLSLNHHLFGLRPWGWHGTSLLLHGMVSGLLFFLLRRHGLAPWIALVAALLFALNPVHVESVVWISGSTDLLAAAALLLSLLLWWKSTEEGPRRALLLLSSLAFYAMALLGKETAIVFPAIILLYAYFHSARSAGRAARQALPFLAVAVAYLAGRQMLLGAPPATFTLAGLETTLATAPGLLLFYSSHLLWPVNLSLFYNFFPRTFSFDASFLLPLSLLAVLGGAALYLAVRFPGALLPGLSWLLFPLLPVLWVPLFAAGDLAHDRYLYLPSIGLALLAGEGLARAAARGKTAAFLKTLAALLLALLAVRSALGSRPWRSDSTLYSHACRVSPGHPIACNNLAVALIAQGEYARAREVLRPLLKGNSARVNGNFGIASYRLRDYEAAEGALERATDLDPSYADAYLYQGLTRYRANRLPEAESLVRRALALDPAGEGYHLALGSILMAQSKLREACAEFRAELVRRPELPAALGLLHDCQQRLGQVPQ